MAIQFENFKNIMSDQAVNAFLSMVSTCGWLLLMTSRHSITIPTIVLLVIVAFTTAQLIDRLSIVTETPMQRVDVDIQGGTNNFADKPQSQSADELWGAFMQFVVGSSSESRTNEF